MFGENQGESGANITAGIWGLQILTYFWQSSFLPSLEEASAITAEFTTAEKHPKPKYESSLNSEKKHFENTFLNLLSFHKALCCTSCFRSDGKEKVPCKLNYCWLENIMMLAENITRLDRTFTGLQISCRCFWTSPTLSTITRRYSTHSLRPYLKVDNCLSNWLTFVELSFPWDITPSTHTHQKKE